VIKKPIILFRVVRWVEQLPQFRVNVSNELGDANESLHILRFLYYSFPSVTESGFIWIVGEPIIDRLLLLSIRRRWLSLVS
jgi:hypothetical protein